METFTSGTDEDDVTGAEDNGADGDSDVTVAEEYGVDDLGGVAGIEDVVTANKVVDAVDDSEFAEVGFTDTATTFAGSVDDSADVEGVFANAENDFIDVETNEVQSPKPAWQPFPGCAGDEPQYLLLEEQFPNAEDLQLRLFLNGRPQRAAVLLLRASAPRNGRAAMVNSRAECIANEGGQNEWLSEITILLDKSR